MDNIDAYSSYAILGNCIRVFPPLIGIEPVRGGIVTGEIHCVSAASKTPDAFRPPNWETIARHESRLVWPGVAVGEVYSGTRAILKCSLDIPEMVRQGLVLNTLGGMMSYQRGASVLHASAVERDGKVIAICGPSGAGKSSLAAMFVSRGWSLVSDDTVSINADEMTLVGSGAGLKLDPSVIENVGIAVPGLAVLGEASRGRCMINPRHFGGFKESGKLVALVFVDGIGPTSCAELSCLEVIRRLMRNILPTRFGFLADSILLTQVGKIARDVVGVRLIRGDRDESFSEALEAVLEKIRSL